MKWFVSIVLGLMALGLLVPIVTGNENNFAFNWIVEHDWLLCLLLWNLFALAMAKFEAMYFSLKSRNSLLDQYNEHPMFAFIRAIVLALIWKILGSFLPVVLLAGMFPFVHDGFYYLIRNKIDGVYPKRWLSHPKKSTAIFDIAFKYPLVRTGFFVASLTIYLWYYLQ